MEIAAAVEPLADPLGAEFTLIFGLVLGAEPEQVRQRRLLQGAPVDRVRELVVRGAPQDHGPRIAFLGRDSLDDEGLPLVITVNSNFRPCPNAFWNGSQLIFCSGMVCDDILAHEFTHGLTEYTANLIYQNQCGQLNESFSDIFGELVDLFNGDPAWPTHPSGSGTDSGTTIDPAKWMIAVTPCT